MNACTQRLLSALDAHGCRPTPSGRGYKAHCPTHDDDRESLSIDEGEDGRVLICCHVGCKAPAIVAAVGLKMADLFSPR